MAGSRLPPLDAEGLAALIPVSRETIACLEEYLALLERWQKTINLVGRSTLEDPWRRHVLDCAQLVRFLPQERGQIADLGSGAGLPGVILAILGVPCVHLVESDRRKAQFLRETARQLDLRNVTIHAARSETLTLKVNVITARALAPLPLLLELAVPLLEPGGRLVLLKGRSAAEELVEGRRWWSMQASIHSSMADDDGSVLVLEEVFRREA